MLRAAKFVYCGQSLRDDRTEHSGIFSISSGSSDLLDVVIHSQWKSGVYDKVDVGFIDSQAECCCRNNEGTIFRFELIENAFALLFRQFSVEAQRFPILALASSE